MGKSVAASKATSRRSLRSFANGRSPLFTIVRDDVGRHDFLLTPCSPKTFAIIHNERGPHPSCFSNLCTHLAPFGIELDQIPTTFNIFMNVEMDSNGTIAVRPPRSRAGDRFVVSAETDLIVGLTACSAGQSNNDAFKPIQYGIAR